MDALSHGSTVVEKHKKTMGQMMYKTANVRKKGFLPHLNKAETSLFILIIILVTGDLIADYEEGVSLAHLLVEFPIFLSAFIGMSLNLWRTVKKLQSTEEVLKRSEARSKQLQIESEQWRERAQHVLHGLSREIQAQFEQWQLSPAEQEVGFMLIKGLSFRDIAVHRNTSEKTARRQAAVVYEKSGVTGRAELSAFFLEDLLLPREITTESEPHNKPASP